MTKPEETDRRDLTRRKFLKWTTGGILGATGLTLGIRPWEKSASGVTVSQRRPAMGTFVEIKATGKDESRLTELIDSAFRRIDEVDESMSVFKEKSRIHRLNRSGEKSVRLTQGMAEVLAESRRISELTDGAFDVTAAPLLDLWGFYDGKLSVPSEGELEETLRLVDYRGLELDGARASLADPRAALDLGGVAKGYGVDAAVEVLKQGGASAGLVNAGGDVRGFGSPEERDNWRVGLQHPRSEDDLLGTVDLLLPAITTSGNYESFFTYRGSKLAHIVDPRTGRPVEDVLSVTVLAEEAVRADGLSTGAFCQEVSEALETVESLPDTELIYVSQGDSGKTNVELSSGLTGELDRKKLEGRLN